MKTFVKPFHLYVGCLALLLLWGGVYAPCPARAQGDVLPQIVGMESRASFVKVGQGTYRKFGFRVYDATLWAPYSKWDAAAPYALQLTYTRSLSKETLIDTVMDDIEEQGIADEGTRARWRQELEAALSDVNEGDELVGLALPGKKTILVYNGKVIAQIKEQAFSDAFFSIWLGHHANEDLRAELLGNVL